MEPRLSLRCLIDESNVVGFYDQCKLLFDYFVKYIFQLLFACLILYNVLYEVMRRTREQIRIDNRPKRVLEYISKNKYLVNSVHYKNNYWSWAAWDSWAAQGKAGGCGICGNGYYSGTLKNKRAKTKRSYHGATIHENYAIDVSIHICSECVTLIHKEIGVEFKKK